MPMRPLLTLLLISLLSACTLNPTDIHLQQGWNSQSLSAWRDHHPDQVVISDDGKWLYVSCTTNASLLAPSLLAINIETGKQHILLFGLHRADALKKAPDGSLWIGEGFDDGLFWRITEPDQLPDEQRVDRSNLDTSSPAIIPMHRAGNFDHQALAFSKDGTFAYMADAWKEGCLYRFHLQNHQLEVLHKEKGWLPIRDSKSARLDAEKLHAQYFDTITDMTALPDGRLLLAEKGTGRILLLDDATAQPHVETWLKHDALLHPNSVTWDEARGWLWITDEDKPSYLWAWDGRTLQEIARHDSAIITGVTLHKRDVYINLQRELSRPEVLLRLRPTDGNNTL